MPSIAISTDGKHAAPARPPRVRPVPALSRGIAILRLLGRSENPLGVHAIARELGLVPSTCLHILRVLTEERLLAFDPLNKKYQIAAGLVVLARSAVRGHTFAAVVQSELEQLAAQYGATAIGVEASGLEHMVVVALARTDSTLGVHVDIGSRFPALISATGRCIAAFGNHSWTDIRARFARLRWDEPPAFTSWRSEVAAAKQAGYAVDDGQYIRGVSIIAAPVGMADGAINALVIVGVAEQIRRIGPAMIGEELKRRAAHVTQLLGGRALLTERTAARGRRRASLAGQSEDKSPP